MVRCKRVRQRYRLRWKELQARATDGQTAPCLHPWRPVPKQTERRTTNGGGCVLRRMQAAGLEATHTAESENRPRPKGKSADVCVCDAPELATEVKRNRTRHSPTQLPHSATVESLHDSGAGKAGGKSRAGALSTSLQVSRGL